MVINRVTEIRRSIILLYRKCSTTILHYIDGIRNLLNDYEIDIVLGDLNINFLNQEEIKPLITLMDSLHYTQVVQSPIFVSAGSLPDHVYVKSNFDTIQCSVLAVYYSHCHAVKITIIGT